MKAKLNSRLAIGIVFVIFNLAIIGGAYFSINYSVLLTGRINIRDRAFKTFSARTDRSYQNCGCDYFFHTANV